MIAVALAVSAYTALSPDRGNNLSGISVAVAVAPEALT
jgi:hypothetical protein